MNLFCLCLPQILLPELSMLRVCVYDDDKEIVGQRTVPVNAIRPGFRHINLRDKHGTPLPLAMLFVLITVEDWVPNEMEGGYGLGWSLQCGDVMVMRSCPSFRTHVYMLPPMFLSNEMVKGFLSGLLHFSDVDYH